jgi:hypothetical protein
LLPRSMGRCRPPGVPRLRSRSARLEMAARVLHALPAIEGETDFSVVRLAAELLPFRSSSRPPVHSWTRAHFRSLPLARFSSTSSPPPVPGTGRPHPATWPMAMFRLMLTVFGIARDWPVAVVCSTCCVGR